MARPSRQAKTEGMEKTKQCIKSQDNYLSLIQDQVPYPQYIFIRNIPYNMVHYNRIDDEYKLPNEIDKGILVNASIPFPKKKNGSDYIAISYFDNEDRYYGVDPYNLMRDDCDYYQHLNNILELNQVPWLPDVFKQFSLSLLTPKEHELRGQKKLATANTKQVLHRFASKVHGKLRFDQIKVGKSGCRVDLNYNDWNISGHIMLCDLSQNYRKRGVYHKYSEIMIENIKDIVGLDKLSKKSPNGNRYLWIDQIDVTYNEQLQALNFSFIQYDDESNIVNRSMPNVRRSRRISNKSRK